MMAKITLINFVSNYELTLAKDEESINTDYTVHVFKYAAGGLNVRFKKREQKL